ncbi:MAG: helix-turn-helix transcriptional regulator [Hyphomicrobiales bacterium]|nr:helix-turn-helix transcriptional regulator [Hyphomicrobiales bacterium]MCY4032593.1 helix-turn-helix transcriptional regulator [Hyphomicrobiales bacterium]MCY4037996.1 helix-turn-helix transcriptional regulator [Hyphomicrobiales bacterium]
MPKKKSAKQTSGKPHPVDVYVGKRIKQLRWLKGMTQQQLAKQVGVKFQQVQKYETGANRVSASRLWQLCEALNVPVSFFFEGYPENKPSSKSRGFSENNDVLNEREALELVRAYYAHPAGFRRHILDLVKSLPKYFTPRSTRRT